MHEQQSATDILMIRPASFCANAQTAESNRFQQMGASQADSQQAALREFDALASALSAAGVRVNVFDDTVDPQTPDALFPNNWVSFHADGTVVLYPMLAPNRRLERRADILESMSKRHGYHSRRIVDLSHHELQGRFLEGTGSLVLDRTNRIAYACLSPRTHLDLLGDFAQQCDYEIVAFEASDAGGVAIYHTNVLMSIGTRFAVVCAQAISSSQREPVLKRLSDTGHQVIEVTIAQMEAFAGNILELATPNGKIVALSEQAVNALSPGQRQTLTLLAGPLISSPIPTIETLGGGSVRCMLGEIHLSRAAQT